MVSRQGDFKKSSGSSRKKIYPFFNKMDTVGVFLAKWRHQFGGEREINRPQVLCLVKRPAGHIVRVKQAFKMFHLFNGSIRCFIVPAHHGVRHCANNFGCLGVKTVLVGKIEFVICFSEMFFKKLFGPAFVFWRGEKFC